MKYIKSTFTNLILLLLVLGLSLCGVSCSDKEEIRIEPSEESPEDSSEESVSSKSEETGEISETEIILSLEDAVALIEKDRAITEIFLCNSLCPDEAKTKAEYFPLSKDNKYYSFSEIESLINSVYLTETEKEFFLSYPLENVPSVSDNDGITNVFYHDGIGYTDFIDEKTISVINTEEKEIKLIKCKTLSGKSLLLKTVLVGKEWRLEKGIYFSNAPAQEFVTDKLPLSGLGSMSKLNGKVLVVEIFMTDSESSFEKETEEEYHKKISSAVDFAASQAEAFGAEIEITYQRAYFDHRNIIENNPLSIDFIFDGTGFGSLGGFIEGIVDVSEYDSYCAVVCMNKEFDSYFNIYDDTQETEKYICEKIVVGNDFSEQQIYFSFLRLAGEPYMESGYLKDVYNLYFPNNPLLKDDYKKSEMSEITAYSCGVIDKLSKIYSIFLEKDS